MNLKEHSCSEVSLSSESSPTTSPSPYSMTPRGPGTHISLAAICAIFGLFVFPEIFDSVAIVLGAYAWKKQQGNTGLYVVILGLICMLVGMYFTAFVIGDLFLQ
jgi:hypothetical protein